jgi:hypothetical protein
MLGVIAASQPRTEVTVNRISTCIRTARRRIGWILGSVAVALAATAFPAFARPVPPGGPDGSTQVAQPDVYTITAGGMPGWEIVLIAVGAALAAAVVAVLADRAWAARRRLTAGAR